MSLLAAHHRLAEVRLPGAGVLLTSPAVRGYPRAAPGLAELLDAVGRVPGRVADVTASAGGGALAGGRVDVLEPSYAAWRAARERFGAEEGVSVRAALPWELERRGYDAVLLIPPTERGNDRVRAELDAAARALRPGGSAYLAMHKDRGAKRYEREAGERFASVTVLERTRGWRVVRLEGPATEGGTGGSVGGPGGQQGIEQGNHQRIEQAGQQGGGPRWHRFEALGRTWWALPGVYASKGLDPGSAVLLGALEAMGAAALEGAEVADLGCGTGVLAHGALLAGAARVTGLDDDLGAVASARRNLAGSPVNVLHSDLDAALDGGGRFDAVLVNPPFHVGREVRLEIPRAFLATAQRLLRPGGSALVVANSALPYERELATWSRFETVTTAAGFKVLRAWRGG